MKINLSGSPYDIRSLLSTFINDDVAKALEASQAENAKLRAEKQRLIEASDKSARFLETLRDREATPDLAPQPEYFVPFTVYDEWNPKQPWLFISGLPPRVVWNQLRWLFIAPTKRFLADKWQIHAIKRLRYLLGPQAHVSQVKVLIEWAEAPLSDDLSDKT